MGNIRTYKTLIIEGVPEQISLVSSFLIDKSYGLEEENCLIKLYFDNKNIEKIDSEISTLKQRFSFESKWEIHEYQDWHLNWKENFKPIFFNNEVVIKPDWDKNIYDVKHEIIIKPGMAFGTGHHETTSLMLESMIRMIKEGDSVLDLGSGSGILSIAASKFGGSEICAIDNDNDCYENFFENMKLNNISDINFYIYDVLNLDDYNYDVILANINKNVLVNLLPKLSNSKATIILSGLLDSDEVVINDICKLYKLDIISKYKKSEWISIVLKGMNGAN